MITPPSVKKGARIGITCPAGYMAAEKTDACVVTLQAWGYEVMVGKTIGSGSETYFSGTDEERCEEFQAMLDSPEIDAILCGRGGYGMSRIIDQLDFKAFKKNPKWIVGFSDVTVLHCHLQRKYKISSIHAQMAAAFNEGGDKSDAVLSLRKLLEGKKTTYSVDAHDANRKGEAEGELIGGNLTLLANIIGTPSDYDTRGKILFIEDLGEYLYSIDRMLIQLKRAGKFKGLTGLIFGGFTDLKDTDRPFGKTIDEILEELVAEYDFPVCFHFPVSHGTDNMALQIGANYRLKVTTKKVVLKML